MHPDAGAIIGISLAGSVLVVALLFLCMLNLPCCKQQVKPGGGGGGSRRNPRPSTSSRSAILDFPFTGGGTRNIRTLSALDLHTQNPDPHFLSGSTAGLSNPLWQMECHSCGMFVAASQHSLNRHHQCPNQVPCHCYHHPDEQTSRNNSATGHSPNNVCANNSTSFQYSVPQLLSPAESPPPYPGSPYNVPRAGTTRVVVESTINEASSSSLAVPHRSNPPPYNPKF